MLAQQELVVLKLFSGPQLGGEAVLSPGEYLLGRDASCDIVIDDILVEAQHCRLIVGEDSVQLESLDGAVYVEGQLFQGGSVELFDYIMIGGSCFALGTTKSQWPARPVPEIRREPRPSSDAATPLITSDADNIEVAGTQAAPDVSEDPSTETSREIADGTQRRAWAAVILVVISISIISLLAIAASRGFSEEVAQIDQETQPIEERLWEIARSQAFESDIRVENSQRGWMVVGYLDKRADRQLLANALRKVLPSAAIKLWDSETLAESAQAVLTSLHVPLSAKPGKSGTVVVSGDIKDLDQWSSARERILRDISAIRNLDDQAVTATSKKTIERLRPVAVEPAVPTPAALSPTTLAAASPAPTVEGAAKPSEPLPVIRNVYLLPADAEAPPRPNPSIRSVSVGACRSVVTTEGTRVMKGGRLDGWLVMEIAEDKVVLERGKFRHIVDLLAP